MYYTYFALLKIKKIYNVFCKLYKIIIVKIFIFKTYFKIQNIIFNEKHF